MASEAKHLFFALTNPVDGQEDAFEEWYDKHHVDEVVSIPGFVSGQRYELSPAQREGQASPPPWRYLAVYEFEGEIEQIHEVISQNAHRMTLSPACADDHAAWVYSPIGERHEPEEPEV